MLLLPALSCAKKIDRDPKVYESPRKIDYIHQNDSIVATRACTVATKMRDGIANSAFRIPDSLRSTNPPKNMAGSSFIAFSVLRWIKTIATWKTVIESMNSLGMDNFRVA